MSVTAARKGLQIPLGFRLGATAAPFVFWPTDPLTGLTVIPTGTPTITLYGSDGSTVKLAAANMTSQADASWVYWADLSNTTTFPEGAGYQAAFSYVYSTHTLSGARRTFGIYPEPAQPDISDQDLTGRVSDLNNYLGDRTNWSDIIQEAWNQTFRQLAMRRHPDGARNIDPYELKTDAISPIHQAKALAMICGEDLAAQEGDRFYLLAQRFDDEFSNGIEALMASLIEQWSTGPVVAETPNPRVVRSHIKAYGSTDDTASTYRGSGTPSWTRSRTW